MTRPALALASLLVLLLGACSAPHPAGTHAGWLALDDEAAVEQADTGHGIGHRLLFWIPNRIFDVFDVVRARVRLGPGFGISVRATELADLNLSAYTAVWLGVHGPRGEPSIPWPFGAEAVAKAEVSVADADAGGPYYGPVEFGAGFQALLIGVDVGVEPWEILDLVAGIFTFDPAGDDF